MSTHYQISPVLNGHYKVTIDLSKWLPQYELSAFAQEIQRIASEDDDFEALCSLNGSVLQYTSESLFPEIINQQKKKVLIVLGNPATHSVAGGMFFYSRSDGNRHQFWGKLAEAGLMPRVKLNSLEQEAIMRKKIILEGATSHRYLLGLTTFYSFPTPVHGTYQDSKGVETLFRAVLNKIQLMELERLLSYPFSHDALFVFTQKSSYHRAMSAMRGGKTAYWPLRGSGSSGIDLLATLNQFN